MLEECLELRRGVASPTDIAATLSTLSLARLRAGDTKAAEDAEQEALKVFRSTGDIYGEAIGLFHIGEICHRDGRHDESRRYLQQCLTLAQQLGNQEIEGACRLMIGEVAFDLGELSEAQESFNRSLVICQAAADRGGEANATRWLGKCDLRHGRREMARARLDQALRSFVSFEMWEELLACLEDVAECVSDGDASKATRLLSAVERARERLQLPRPEEGMRVSRNLLRRLRDSLEASVFESQWQSGQALDIREAITQAQAPADEPAPG